MARRGANGSKPKTVYLSGEGAELLKALGQMLGVDDSDVIEIAIRAFARDWGIEWGLAKRVNK